MNGWLNVTLVSCKNRMHPLCREQEAPVCRSHLSKQHSLHRARAVVVTSSWLHQRGPQCEWRLGSQPWSREHLKWVLGGLRELPVQGTEGPKMSTAIKRAIEKALRENKSRLSLSLSPFIPPNNLYTQHLDIFSPVLYSPVLQRNFGNMQKH